MTERFSRNVETRFRLNGLRPEIAGALHRQYDGVRGGPKVVVELTGANQRTVGNWFDAKNGPTDSLDLIALCRHSERRGLDTVLMMAGRNVARARALKLALAQQAAHDLCAILDALGEE